MELGSLELRIARSENLPSVSQVSLEILKRIDDPSMTGGSLESLIILDPAITAKILKVANSAAYGGDGITSIARALNMLGNTMVKRLVMAVAFQQMIFDETSPDGFDKIEFWRHSYAVGILSREIIRDINEEQCEELFCAGMFHDIGRLVLERFCYAHSVVSFKVAAVEKKKLVDAELKVLGWTHHDAGTILARKWGFSPVICSAIEFHHSPMLDVHNYESTCAVAYANNLAHRLGFVNNNPSAEYELDPMLEAELNLDEEKINTLSILVCEEVARAEAAFNMKRNEPAAA